MFSQTSVALSVGGGVGGVHVWQMEACVMKEGICGKGEDVWQRGSMHGERGHAWQRPACLSKGTCMVKGGMYGRGHAWLGECVGGGVCGRGHV